MIKINKNGVDYILTAEEEAEHLANIARIQSDKEVDEYRHKRAAAYVAESDPLFFKAQRGEATMEEWQAKVAEIKTRYPKA